MSRFDTESTNIIINILKGGIAMDDIICYIEQKDVFTVYEAARYLTVSTKTVYHLMHTGQLDYIKIGCRYKIEAFAIREYLDKLHSEL